MSSQRFAQSLVTIAGRAIRVPLGERVRPLRVVSAPPFAKVALGPASAQLLIKASAPGRGHILFETEAGERRLLVVAFAEREAFLITALSSNVHRGWDPSLHDRLPHPECCGPDRSGNAFVHVRNMERLLHGAGLPITWFLDVATARDNREDLREWRGRHGDEIGFMPSSFSHFNPVNFNTERTLEQTTDLLQVGVEQLGALFDARIDTVAIDQFIGSVGTHFTHAAASVCARALWGVGFDHFECDTSMHHGGCPWNPYRPSRANFRVPGDDPLPLWVFQWTFRDLINTVHVPGGMSGAVMFSTDVDDIIFCNVAHNQPDYYRRLAEGLLANRNRSDMLVMTIHQEDHDSWHREGLDYLERFYGDLPGGFTPATMGEVAAWLDLKWPIPAHPAQCLRLEDPLECKDDVEWNHPGLERPADWPADGVMFPPHIFHCDENAQLIFVEGEHAPLRFIDHHCQGDVPETGTCQPEALPRIDVLSIEASKGHLACEIESDGDCARFPLAVWTDCDPPEGALTIAGGYVIFIALRRGRNQFA